MRACGNKGRSPSTLRGGGRVTVLQFERVAPDLAERVAAGATVEDACRAANVKVNTARSWLRKGRTDPAGKYGPFAAAIDTAKSAQVVPTAREATAMSRAEWETHLAEAIRSGSVQAMRLWFAAHPLPQEKPADAFAEFD